MGQPTNRNPMALASMEPSPHKREYARGPYLECEDPVCELSTKQGKAFCLKHIEKIPYVSRLLSEYPKAERRERAEARRTGEAETKARLTRGRLRLRQLTAAANAARRASKKASERAARAARAEEAAGERAQKAAERKTRRKAKKTRRKERKATEKADKAAVKKANAARQLTDDLVAKAKAESKAKHAAAKAARKEKELKWQTGVTTSAIAAAVEAKKTAERKRDKATEALEKAMAEAAKAGAGTLQNEATEDEEAEADEATAALGKTVGAKETAERERREATAALEKAHEAQKKANALKRKLDRIDPNKVISKYSSAVGKRLHQGRVNAAAAGRHQSGPAPFGYMRDYNKGVVLLVPCPVESETVKAIFRDYLRVRSMKRLCTLLNEQGSRTRRGKLWSRPGVSWILKNKTYTGRVHFGKIDVEGIHEAIIERTVFNKVQRLVKANNKKGDRGYQVAQSLPGNPAQRHSSRVSQSTP